MHLIRLTEITLCDDPQQVAGQLYIGKLSLDLADDILHLLLVSRMPTRIELLACLHIGLRTRLTQEIIHLHHAELVLLSGHGRRRQDILLLFLLMMQ